MSDLAASLQDLFTQAVSNGRLFRKGRIAGTITSGGMTLFEIEGVVMSAVAGGDGLAVGDLVIWHTGQDPFVCGKIAGT